MALNTNERLQEAFSLALEDRSKGYADLVSNSNALLHVMKKRDQFKEFSGPTIRERLLYGETNSYIRYSGYQLLNPTPAELFNDAEFTPKLAAVSVTLSGEDILKNSGVSQLKDIMEEHIGAAEQELTDRFVEDLHSAGVAANQIGGLQLVLPTNVSAGTYGGIARSNAIWQTSAYDANSGLRRHHPGHGRQRQVDLRPDHDRAEPLQQGTGSDPERFGTLSGLQLGFGRHPADHQ